jgi:hypothetical protein
MKVERRVAGFVTAAPGWRLSIVDRRGQSGGLWIKIRNRFRRCPFVLS